MNKLLYFSIIPAISWIATTTYASAELNSSNQTHSIKSNESDRNEKHKSLLECDLFELDSEEYVLFPNGTAYVEIYKQTYNESFYILIDNFLRVCSPSFSEEERLTGRPLSYLSFIGVCISMVCLLMHLIAFVFVSDLQNLPGYNLASLCASLFLSYMFLIIGQRQQDSDNTTICIISGVLTHFFFLASFLWMFILAFDVFRSIILATTSLIVSSKKFKLKKYMWYSLFTWFTAAIFSAAAVMADNVKKVPDPYRPMFHESCWFDNKKALLAFFAIPIGILICLNFIMFGLRAYSILTNQRKAGHEIQCSNLRKNHILYLRLSVIMGVTWITGVLAPIANVTWLWYTFAALNAFQGLFIFLAFTCTNKVKKYFCDKLLGGDRSSEQTLSPTFQSYCYYANSIEKDLDKVMNSKDKSGVTDTIIIHL